jgi:hypothetical protein
MQPTESMITVGILCLTLVAMELIQRIYPKK